MVALLSLILTLIIDVCMFALCTRPVSYLTMNLCLMHIFLFSGKGVITLFIFGSVLIFFLYSGELTISALCFAPIVMSIMHMRSLLYMNRLLFILINIFFIWLYAGCVQGLQIAVSIDYYTFIKISVNMILIVLLSLKLSFQSSQGNRCAR